MGDLRTPESILQEARTFYKNRKSATWNDYEYFKHKLHFIRAYGYERELADALHL